MLGVIRNLDISLQITNEEMDDSELDPDPHHLKKVGSE
jgi:hypothetical protein